MTNPPQPPPQVQWILWASLIGSQIVYVGILSTGAVQVGEPGELEILAPALAVAALVLGGVAHLFWRRASGAGRALHAQPEPGPPAFTGQLVAWVLDEAIAIFGFLLGLLGFAAGIWGCFFAASLTLMILHRPRAQAR